MSETTPLQARFGPFRLDEAEALLVRDDAPVDLTPRSFQVLCALLRHPGQLVTKDALLDEVWGHRHVNEAALKNIVSQLRQALGDDAREARFIQTAARRGYRFIAPVVLGTQAAAVAPILPAPAPVPVPVRAPRTALVVGRDRPLAQLQAALAASLRGERRLVFLLGDAGIGKSTLVDRIVAAPGTRPAFGQCIEHYGRGEPYMPVLEALNALCRADDGTEVVGTLRRVAPTWLLQLPWLVGDEDRRALLQEAAGATQDRMLREFGELADRLAAQRPLLLVLEDLHWSDHATVQLLAYLARRRGPAAVMVLGTFRPTELILEDHPLADLRLELRMHGLSEEIDLEALSEAELGALAQARLGRPVPDGFARALHAHTSGLPLFVANMLDELVASGSIGPCREFPEPGQLAVPSSIVGLVDRQVSRLTPQQQALLAAASVCGIDFQHVPLAEVLELPGDEVQPLLDEVAARLPWLRSTGGSTLADGRIAASYAFTHSLYRRVLYERLPASQRMQLHRLWATALARLHAADARGIAAELALHFERGGLPAAAAAQLAMLAARALRRGAGHEALQAARHALRIGAQGLDAPLEQELRVLEAVALSRMHVVSEPEVADAFARARAVGAVESPSWPQALQGCWWVHFARAEFGPARALASEMLALAQRNGDQALQIIALNAMGLVLMMTGEEGAARVQLEASLAACAAAGELPSSRFVQDPASEATASLAMVSWVTGRPVEARALARKAVALATARRHALSEVTALYSAAIVHSLAGEFDAVHALTEQLYEVLRRDEAPGSRGGFAWMHGRALAALGQVDEGLAEMRAAAETNMRLGSRTGLASYHFHYAQACRLAGRLAEARTMVEAGLPLAEHNEHMLLSPLLLERAELHAAAGDTAAADACLTRAIAVARQQDAVFYELMALASAQRLGAPSANTDRLRALLARYEGDPSPAIAAARAVLDRGPAS